MNCEIIQDLLPLYCDGVCSAETIRAVEAHLASCPACRTLLEEMRREPVMPEPIQAQACQEARVLRGVKRKFSLRRRFSVLAVALAALAALAVLTAASDVEKPVPYEEGLVTAELAVDEAIDIHFLGAHRASFRAFSRETADGTAIFFCYTQTLKSAIAPLPADRGHICIGNTLMTDFTTASSQVPDSQDIDAIYYLEADRQDYIDLPQMSDSAFSQAVRNAVLLWERETG